ncbi:hypothetical protein GN244_ATG10154 [Phytophthora infestans]|uniref:Uncharacterized protein n=1 Tax=Phytophthora infestans TaxID=4787 RepID=A0A833T6H3_PHYIN|nr:hypothetical protein GN244_ATG10154 [Phytophthora infestans]
MFTPSPQRNQDADQLAEGSDEEDPGDGVSDAATLLLWGEYLDEMFQDEELDTVFAQAETSSSSTCRADQAFEKADEFEEIAAAVIHKFPADNVPNFPQELKLSGFKTQNATLKELFGIMTV